MPLPYPDVRGQNDEAVQRNFEKISLEWPSSLFAPGGTVAALPTTGQDGQVIRFLADSTNGVVWSFRYRSASGSSYKWEFLGGPGLTDTAAGSSTRTNTAYGALGDADGPSVTLPLTGDYDVSFGAQEFSSNTNGQPAYMSIGTSAPADDASAVMVYNYNATGANRDDVTVSVCRTVRLTGLAASGVLAAYYRAGTGATVQAKYRWLSVIPVRVG